MNDCIAGVDEAGRGPLAGSVVAAAVILHPGRPIAGLRDSKRLTPRRREILAETIRAQAWSWALGWCTAEEIDRINILQASLLAMRRAIDALSLRPTSILVDGIHDPACGLPARMLVGGDDLEPAISAASILAKTTRDAQMLAAHAEFPGYGFDRHKGYPTREHLQALRAFGPTPLHRRSFAPVRRTLAGAGDGS